jgi:hypothetical protein
VFFISISNKERRCYSMNKAIKYALTIFIICLSVYTLLKAGPTFLTTVDAQTQGNVEEQSAEPESTQSSPPDTTPYVRELVPEDLAPSEELAVGADGVPGIFIVDVVVNNTNPNLTNTDNANDGETSIAVNPLDPDEIVIAAFSGPFGANFPQGAPFYHSTDGGLTWTQQLNVPAPPGVPAAPPMNCSLCDWTWDWGRNNQLSASILVRSPTIAGVDVVTGTTTDPTQIGMWNWFDPPGPPVQVQVTNINAPGSIGNADQPWMLVNPDPFSPIQDNVYVGYDDFNNTDGVDGVDTRVAVSFGANPPNFTVDQQVGNSRGFVNPGLRLAEDPRTGFMYALWGRCDGPNCAQADDPKNTNYMLNRTVDGGNNWTLNGNVLGIVVANAQSSHPQPKFGTVNALLGGVHHAAVDPNTGDLYYVYGNRDAGTGNDRLAIRRVVSDGMGNVIIGAESFVTGQVEAAIPVVAVTDNGTVGVFYYTFDGFSSDDFPIFTAHLALSEDHGVTFTTHRLLTFLSSATDSGNARQRVLGDYMQMQTVGNCFYGSFTGNGAPFGRPVANHDPIFFKTCVGPQIQIPGGLSFSDTCVGSTSTETLDVCNTGVENLVVESITSSDPQVVVTTPSGNYPVIISPDFCFPFEVVFTPTSAASLAASLIISSNDPADPAVTVTVTGDGTEPDISTSGELDFGELCIGDSVSEILQVCNTGKCDLTVTGAELVGPDCDDLTLVSPTPDDLPLVISPDFCFEFVVKFEPDDDVPPDCSLEIETDDPDEPTITVPITATVGNSDLVLDPADLTGLYAFPATVEDPNGDLGCYSDRMLVARNVGTCPLVIDDMSATAPFSVIAPTEFPITLPPGEETLDVTIRLAPTSGGGSVISPDDVTGTRRAGYAYSWLTSAILLLTGWIC